MSRKVPLVMLVVLLASLVMTPAVASDPGEPPFPKPPLSWPGVPTMGPLTPAEIKKLPAPPKDTSALDEQFKAGLAKIEAAAAAKGLKVRALPTKKLEAGVALGESLTDEQRQAIGEAFSRREKTLRALMAPIEVALKAKGKPEAVALEVAWRLEGRLQAWQAALDSDVEKVLMGEQLAQYRTSRPTVQKLGVSTADLAALGLEVPRGEGTSLQGNCTSCCYDYYSYYGYLYQYYAYVYAYYGYYYSGCSWAYHAYVNNYYGYYYSYYAYVYGYDYDACYYGYYAYLYSYYGYVYSYYAYYYCYDAHGYLYTSYCYAYWGYIYSWNGYCCACDCWGIGLLGLPSYKQEQRR